MSRLAKKPITFPAGVTVTLDGSTLAFTGPKGKLDLVLSPAVSATIEGSTLTLASTSSENDDFAQWGLMWALVQSKMNGVSTGFTKSLEIQWVGYRSEISGNKLTLAVGFSHKVVLEVPATVSIAPDAQNANILIVSGIDAQEVGQFAGKIRAVKPPEPYKWKGIRYVDEFVRRKAGKTGAK